MLQSFVSNEVANNYPVFLPCLFLKFVPPLSPILRNHTTNFFLGILLMSATIPALEVLELSLAFISESMYRMPGLQEMTELNFDISLTESWKWRVVYWVVKLEKWFSFSFFSLLLTYSYMLQILFITSDSIHSHWERGENVSKIQCLQRRNFLRRGQNIWNLPVLSFSVVSGAVILITRYNENVFISNSTRE